MAESNYHTSEYAGASPEEREAIRNMQCELDAQEESRAIFLDLLYLHCARCSPRYKMSDILNANASWNVTEIASSLGVRRRPVEDQSHLALRVLATLQADEDLVHTCVTPLSTNMMEGLRELYASGGRMTINIDAPFLPSMLPPLHYPFMCYPFLEGNTLTLVMPDETFALFEDIGFDHIHSCAQERWRIIHLAEAISSLHGIAPLETVVHELGTTNDILRSKEEQEGFFNILQIVAQGYTLDAGLLITPKGTYIADKQLACSNLFLGVDPAPCLGVVPNLGPFLSWIADTQRSYVPRSLEPSMVDRESVMLWIRRLPAVQELIRHLDTHVPNGVDDFWYTEDFVDDVLSATLKLSPTDDGPEMVARKLDGYGVAVYGGSRDSHFRQLLAAVCDTAPRWMYRGWSESDVSRHVR